MATVTAPLTIAQLAARAKTTLSVYRVPIKPKQPQEFAIALGSILYRLRFLYMNAPEAGWIMDILDEKTNLPLACGLPLVTGHDILEQYAYLGIPGFLYVATEGDISAPPTFDNFGLTSFLYFIPRT